MPPGSFPVPRSAIGLEDLGSSETERKSEMNRRNFTKRLDRLEALALRLNPPRIRIEFVNDRTPGGLRSVRGPDDRHVWWNPPEGGKVGELLEDSDTPRDEMRSKIPELISVVFIRPRGPKAVPGPDGRFVWLEPPKGCEVGEPIEDSATSMRPFEAEPA